MKKIDLETARRRSWAALRAHVKTLARKHRNYRIVTIRDRIIPPAQFNLSDDYDATVECLRALKVAALTPAKRRERRFVHIDFTPIRRISLAGAVVLAAEIDRWRHTKRAKMRPRDIDFWDPEVKRRLRSLGFFELLGVDYSPYDPDAYDEDNVTLLPLISGQRLDREELYRLLTNIMGAVAKVLRQDPRVYGALTEAVYNSITHAYPEGMPCEFPPLRNGWWATAGWSPKEEVIKFWVYDQGVGIPATLPRSRYWEQARTLLAKTPIVGNNLGDASRMIQAALEVDRTSLDGGHGKGLQDVIAPVQDLARGQVRILSGKGSIIHTGGKTTAHVDRALHLGGTLIEWTIPVVFASE
ncbi:hypothetical protein [Paracoccus fontiphilus]|uniref:ATP-binding protein n=1 Tax=Paracoccus fontiphilus TaxID=1815556 RepID=A0ABV7IKR1_9RHOB|nr:hypothetical protein [Paracoccus fontiphilus]